MFSWGSVKFSNIAYPDSSKRRYAVCTFPLLACSLCRVQYLQPANGFWGVKSSVIMHAVTLNLFKLGPVFLFQTCLRNWLWPLLWHSKVSLHDMHTNDRVETLMPILWLCFLTKKCVFILCSEIFIMRILHVLSF